AEMSGNGAQVATPARAGSESAAAGANLLRAWDAAPTFPDDNGEEERFVSPPGPPRHSGKRHKGDMAAVRSDLASVRADLDNYRSVPDLTFKTVPANVSTVSDNVAASLANVNASMASLRESLSKGHQDLHKYAEQRLNVVEISQKAFIPGSTFDREIDAGIIIVRGKLLVTATAVADAIRGWMEDSNIAEDDWLVEGERTSKKYAIRITGTKALAARKVAQELVILRLHRPPDGAGGVYRSFSATSTAGERSDLFVGPDKNACTIKCETSCKAVRRALEEAFPTRRFFTDKRKGDISSNWRSLIKIIPAPTKDVPEVQWAAANLVAEGIQQSEKESTMQK
ncbi:unnamed protein product, partial [Prorocentrum cordatum]